MKFSELGSSGLRLAALLAAARPVSADNVQWPLRDTELGDTTVQWDHYSLIIKGERVFSFSGEFHPFRIPVPEIWEDLLEKIKAMGMNTMSFYNHWGYHAPWADSIDFETGAHDLSRLYELSKKNGLYVSARPGPYINGELNAGGLAQWATTGAYGLRDNSTEWQDAWKPYMDKFDEITAKYQITQDGTVIMYQIENEFPEQWQDQDADAKVPNEEPIAYMEQLFGNVQTNGIVVPITHNMPGQQYKCWSVDFDDVGAGGDVHIYGLDNYPSCWSCVPDDCSTSNPSFTLADYVAHFNEVSPKQPSMMPEFQGGATNSWYGPSEGCQNKTDDRFVSLYYRDNVAQRVTILNLYMIYGGTNWGSLGAPFQTSSYDYSAAISENRTIGVKFNEIKTLGLFFRVAKDLRKTDMVGNSTTYTSTDAITAIELRNPDTDAGFYAIRPTDPTVDTENAFTIRLRTSAGNLTVPQEGGKLELNGHYAKILPTDFKFGGVNLIYSTAEVLSFAFFDQKPTLALWVFNGEGGEFLIADAKSVDVTSGDSSKVKAVKHSKGLVISFQDQSGQTAVELNNGLRVLILDRDTAHKFWVPALTNDPMVPEGQVVFVQGPHLVRGAAPDGNTLSLWGDSTESTEIEVFAAKNISAVNWNGKALTVKKSPAGSLKADIDGPVEFTVPELGQWKVEDSLPERWTNYSDTGKAWANANHNTTPSKYASSATKPYLFSDDYGFHNGIHLWRGRFDGSASGMYLDVQGGLSHGWSAWLNGEFLGSFAGSLEDASGDMEIDFPEDVLEESENIVVVVQDNSGHDQGSSSLQPRGILNATLYDNEGFTSWRVAGTAGRTVGVDIDPVRTHYSQGGLTAERLGWHLPGFDDSDWPEGSPSDGFSEAGIKFYRTVVELDTPTGHDVSLSVRLGFDAEESSSHFRAYVEVNGYQYGQYLPEFSAERNTFPVPPGIWNYSGDNVLGVLVWNQQQGELVKLDVHIDVNYVLVSSLDVKFDGDYLRPGWTDERLAYE